LIQNDPYIWLYEIDLPTDPPTKLRAAAYPETVYFGVDSLGATIPYVPFSIAHGETTLDVEGGSPTVTLTAQNLTREMAALLETYGFLIGQTVRIRLVRLSETPSGNAFSDDLYEVLDAEMGETDATLSLGQSSMEKKSFPDHRITKDFCTSHYGSARCGYDTKRAGALQTCDKTRDGKNGCVAHGLSELLASLPVLHPKRFRGFPGVQRQGGTGVS
jgi:phage-related protein